MANPRWAESKITRHLPDRVSQIYYAHGLFCSSHPILVILFILSVILFCCYPLLNFPMLGNMPQYFADSVSDTPPRWMHTPPKLYIQQIVIKSSVTPWQNDLILTDAFRAPLAESFKLLEIIHNYQHDNSSLSLDNICLHVEAVKQKTSKISSVLPEYNCLILSPSNLWNQDFNTFQMDSNIINTIYSFQNLAKAKISLAELLFGLPLKDTGIKRYPLRSKQRVIRFAATVFMTHYEHEYILGLRNYLSSLYPITNQLTDVPESTNSSIHIYYPEVIDYMELIPLAITCVMIFLYMYYLVRKMEYIRSKIGMALCAVFTVVASLLMTVGVCSFFGLEFSGRDRGKQVFPYLVIIVGLENIFVLTKSVVSTLPHLDSKIRVAQGLSKEGWNITKNLLIELTILTGGLITFVPAIQEFCIFAIVGVLSDFFLQVVFFATVLSIQIRCHEHSTYPQYSYYTFSSPMTSKNVYTANHHQYQDSIRRSSLPRSQSQPRLSSGQNIVASVKTHNVSSHSSVPKRVKVVNFWASTRIVQRCFMIGMVGWIAVIAYNGGVLRTFIGSSKDTESEETTSSNEKEFKSIPLVLNSALRSSILELETRLLREKEEANKLNSKQGDAANATGENGWTRCMEYDVRKRLSSHHWSSVLSFYNVSLTGNYVTVLPPIHVVQQIPPERALALRNPDEKGVQFRWQSLAAALDPLDFTDLSAARKSVNGDDVSHPLVPSSPVELMMTALLCITSVLVISYTVFVLYKCICTRNYAEWRASWAWSSIAEDGSAYAMQIVLEAVPISVQGHSHQIECIATDGNVIVSTCLAGEVKVWNTVTGELVADIDRTDRTRTKYFACQRTNYSCTGDSDYLTSLLPDKNDLSKNTYVFTENDASPQHMSKLTEVSSTQNVIRRNHMSYPPCSFSSSEDSSLPVAQNSQSSENCVTKDECSNGTHAFSNSDLESASSNSSPIKNADHNNSVKHPVPVWCLDCKDNLVVLGCANGTLEFWECTTGLLKGIYEDEDKVSITVVRLIGRYVIIGKLNGTVTFYRLDMIPSTCNAAVATQSCVTAHGTVAKFRKGHTRVGSAGSILMTAAETDSEELCCVKVESNRVHSQPVTVLEAEGGRAITGSQDHTLKIFNLEDQRVLYNLLGHRGPITCLFIDRTNPTISASGSQDGLLCMWDLHTGTCIYNIQAHDGAICALTYSVSYVISLGIDERLCIWDRFRGHLLNTISSAQAYCMSISMLTHNLLIISKQGCLVLLDVATGEPVRIVKLGHSDNCVFVRQIVNLGDGVICDYGEQLRLVKFPLVCDKTD